jgi:hypothetical protein
LTSWGRTTGQRGKPRFGGASPYLNPSKDENENEDEHEHEEEWLERFGREKRLRHRLRDAM